MQRYVENVDIGYLTIDFTYMHTVLTLQNKQDKILRMHLKIRASLKENRQIPIT